MYFLGWAGFGIWPLALVALVPLWAAVELSLDRGALEMLLLGGVYGLVMIAGGYHWLVPFFEVFSGYGTGPSLVFWLVFSAFIGGQYAVVALLYGLGRRRGWSVALAALPTWLLCEWLYPKLFPVYLANSFHGQTPLLQAAELGGPLLVSAVAVLINVAVFETWRWRKGSRSRPNRVWLAAGGALALSLTFGLIRMQQIDAAVETAEPFRLGIVQVNMGIFEKREDAVEGHRRHLEQSRQLEEEGPLDLLVWPESSYIDSLPRTLPMSGDRVRGSIETPVLFGGVSRERRDDRRHVYNTAFLIDREGTIASSYDKTYLLMFGEYLPLGETFPALYELSPNSGHFTPGSHVEPLTLGDWRISTPICYEDVLPGFTRKMVREAKPHLLINMTNDSWFGATQEPWIHLVLAQLRAIEHRRFLVRATNSGISAVIDPVGRIVAQTGVLTRENIRQEVRMLEGGTVYGTLGDWPGWLSLLAALLMLSVRREPGK